MRKRIFMLAVFFAITAAVMTSVAFRRSPEGLRGSVTFRDYRTDPAGTRFATFVVSNLNSFSVRRSAHCWIEYPDPAGDMTLVSDWSLDANGMDAGGIETIRIMAPTNQPRWRITISFTPNPSAFRESLNSLAVVFSGSELAPFERKSGEICSDWVRSD